MRLVLFALFLLAAAAASPLKSAELPVDLELVLAVDVSLSMDPLEQKLQREGYVRALNSGDVIDAVTAGGTGRIALTYVEWAGRAQQRVVVPWTIVDGAAAMRAFTATIAAAPVVTHPRTALSSALLFAATLFEANGVSGVRRVVDVSGDGPNNQGPPVAAARDLLVAAGIVINGLPLMIEEPGFGLFDIYNLDHYYRQCVIGGPQSFIMPVFGWDGFAAAVKRKLVLEIAGDAPLPLIRVQADPRNPARPAPVIDCLIGEKMWDGNLGPADMP
ncbi:MAG: DUF1194 domain-containing protein [Flavobacteriaceae bacterium]